MEHNIEELGKGISELTNKGRSESGILQGNALTRFTMPNVSKNFSSLELGSPFNCFTGQPGQRTFSREDLRIETNEKPRSESETYSVTCSDDIRKHLKISSGCFLKAAVEQISFNVSQEFFKKFQSEKERNWFFYSCRYEKTTETLIGEPDFEDKMGEDTHYVSSITKGGHLNILYASDKVNTLSEANLIVSEEANISNEAKANNKFSSEKSKERTCRTDLVFKDSSDLTLGHISTVEDIQGVINKFTENIKSKDTETIPLWFEMQPIKNKRVSHIPVNVKELAESWDDMKDAEKDLTELQKRLEKSNQPKDERLNDKLKDIRYLRKQFEELFLHLHTTEPLAMENNACNALEKYREHLGDDSSLLQQASKVSKVVFGTTAALIEMIPTQFNRPFEDTNDFKIVLIGKTGSGKSTFGNILLGKDLFKTASKFESQTKHHEEGKFYIGKNTMTVYDTPGFYDTDQTSAILELRNLYKEVSDGIHCFALVAHYMSASDAEKVFRRIKKNHPWAVLDYMVLVVTHMSKGSIEELLNGEFKALGKEVKGKTLGVREECTYPENKEEQRCIREAFFNMVQKTYDDNDRRPCTKLVPLCTIL